MTKRVEVLLLRRQVAREIVRSLGPMSAYVVAPAFGIPQPRMSELQRDQVGRCSLEWLIERVYRMGGTVTVEVVLGDAGRSWALAHSSRFRGPAEAPPDGGWRPPRPK
ncbi:MAG: XRE family transcriptional regulator [Gemmatimonadota bacterium]|nr:XRE family transcriptional regulator [Gemmatimonadota bacterium]